MLNLRAVLDLDGKGFEAGLARAKGSAAKFGTDLNAGIKRQLGAFLGVTAVAAFSRNTVQYAGHIKDLSQALGISVERLQQFDFAAQQSGASIDDVKTFLRGMANAAQMALGGNAGALDAFKKLGVTVDDLKKKRAEDIFLMIAKAYQQGDFEGKFAALQDVGGRSAINLAASFKDGFASIAEAWKPIEENVINKLDSAGDKFIELAKKIQTGFAPVLAWAVDRVRDLWDFLDITVGGASAFVGTTFNGGSINDGIKAIGEHARQVIDDRIKSEIDSSKPSLSLGTDDQGGFAAGPTERATRSQTPRIGAIEADTLAKIGGTVGAAGDRTQNILREQLAQLRRIEANTKERDTLEL